MENLQSFEGLNIFMFIRKGRRHKQLIIVLLRHNRWELIGEGHFGLRYLVSLLELHMQNLAQWRVSV